LKKGAPTPNLPKPLPDHPADATGAVFLPKKPHLKSRKECFYENDKPTLGPDGLAHSRSMAERLCHFAIQA
jgi:hypothetical protein